MMPSNVDRALDMMRIYLVEHARQPEWSDDRFEELTRTIAACVRQSALGTTPGALRGSTRRGQRGWARPVLGSGPNRRLAGQSYFPPAEARTD